MAKLKFKLIPHSTWVGPGVAAQDGEVIPFDPGEDGLPKQDDPLRDAVDAGLAEVLPGED